MINVTVSIPDRRYRTLITLSRSDRERYWTFHCPRCATPVAEIVNADVVALSDLIDYTNLENVGVGWRCHGTIGSGIRCDIWYYFNLNPN